MKQGLGALFRRTIALLVLTTLPPTVLGAQLDQLDQVINATAAFVHQTVKNPGVDSVGGDWAVVGLGRSGFAVPKEWYEGYYQSVVRYVKERKGVLHERKYTEYSRVILGLTAAGYDPQNVAGYDLTAPLADFDKTVWQGINGPVFALISLDSRDYPNPNRDKYIAEILRRQLHDGGWNLTAGSDGEQITQQDQSDPDITAMALQALAKYQSDGKVKAAIDKGLACLSKMQDPDGGYTSWGGVNSESVVQVIVALGELGISLEDSRFIKNGNGLVDNLMTFSNNDGSFRHTYDGSGNSQMSTEQGLYALVAAQRARDGKTSLYRMGDGEMLPLDESEHGEGEQKESSIGLPNKHEAVKLVPIIEEHKGFSDVVDHPNKSAIEALAARGIINGKTPTGFDPNATMTRAEYAAIITRGLGLEQKELGVFEDIEQGAWYAGFVGAAYSWGIVTGTSETAFNPNGTITRQEAAVMTARAAKLCGMDTQLDQQTIRDTLAQFGDYITAEVWAQGGLAFCYSTGILSDHELDIMPKAKIKRFEIAQMLYNMLENAGLGVGSDEK